MNYISRLFLGTSVVLGSLLAASTDVQSINLYNDYDEEALTQLTDGEVLAKTEGFSPDTYEVIRISPRRQTKKAKTKDFVSPGEYAIFMGCDQECSGVKITVKDASGEKLASAKGAESAHVMVTEVMSGAQPYQIEMEAKCNTGGKHSKVKLKERAVEGCYSYSSIWRKSK